MRWRGFPASDPVLLSNGTYQQTFEGAKIQWTTGNTPVVVFPLSSVLILNSQQGLSLNLGRYRDPDGE